MISNLPKIVGILLVIDLTAGSLVPDFTTTPCSGELISFTCTAPGLDTIWSIPGRDISITSVNTEPVVRDQYTVEVVSVDEPGNMLTSRLSTPAVAGLSIECRGLQGSVGTVVVQTAGTPGPPTIIQHSVLASSMEATNLTIEWDPPTDNGGRDNLTYTVRISPPAQLSATVVTSTSVTVSAADYNVNYTVSVVATNCAGNSTAEEYIFKVVRCSDPQFQPGVQLISVPSVVYLTGATISYGCPGSESVSTCGSDGVWSPDTASLQCPPTALCGPPSPPTNGSIVGGMTTSSVPGTIIMYKCDEGLFPSEDQPSVCGSDGLWSPNPGEIVCVEPFTCSLPTPPTNGFVVEISNSTVVFGCSEGFSPRENKTANCVAMNQWRPSPEQRVCELTTIPPSSSIVGPLIGGVVSGLLLIIVLVIAAIVLVLVLLSRKKKGSMKITGDKKRAPVGPTYEEVGPALPSGEVEIELQSNQAYGQVKR